MVKHVRKDGTQVDSVAGVVLKKDDFARLYAIVEQIEKRVQKNGGSME